MPSPLLNEKFMKMAIQLARKGVGQVSPNPMVGAVLVKNGKIIGKGYHKRFGGPHAEINALENAGARAKESEMYINLEPCCHHAKTPPCVDALIEKRIRRVFVGMIDPNPSVSGNGIHKLKQADIDVEVGLLQNECRRLNESFIKFITKNIPFVTLKAALTLDGKIATYTGDSKWITCEESRKLVHGVRYEVDAVMVGIGTLIADNPLLTVRLYKRSKKNPFKVIVDSSLHIPLKSKVLQPELAEKTIIATSAKKAISDKAQTIRNMGAQVLSTPLKSQRVDLVALLKLLSKKGIASILIEGGSELNASALECGIVDKILFFYSPRIIGGKEAISVVGGKGLEKISDAIHVQDMSIKSLGNDFLVEGYVTNG